MRRCYLVCYDIRDAKRLQRIHRVIKGYGESWQYSVFFCELKEIDFIRLQADLIEIMNQKEDRVVIIDLGANRNSINRNVTSIGEPIIIEQDSIEVI